MTNADRDLVRPCVQRKRIAEADFVCGTNDEDGVAEFLEEQLLG